MEDLVDYYQAMPLPIMRDIEELVKTGRTTSRDGRIESAGDFEILVKIYEVWKKYFPEDYRQFIKSAETVRQDIRSSGKKGIAKGEGEARIMHALEVPLRLHQMIIIFYPNHQYDRKFIRKFVDLLPEFKVTDAKI